MLVSLILTALGVAVVIGLVLWLAFSYVAAERRARELDRRYRAMMAKDPLHFDLELATVDELLVELRRRAAPQYILLLPQFEPRGININMEVHNLPPHVALGLLKMAHRLAARHGGEQIGHEAEEFFPDDDLEV